MGVFEHLDLSPFQSTLVPLVDRLSLIDLRGIAPDTAQLLNRQLSRARALIEEEQNRSIAALDAAGVLDMLVPLSRQRPGAFAADYADLERLYRSVRDRRPELVLELGSGWSTYVIAQALEDNGTGYLQSVDADPEWAKTNAEAIPSHLRHRVELRYLEPVVRTVGHEPVFIHAGLPDWTPDLIFLDGPSLAPTVRAAADVLDLEPRLAPGTLLIVDGRHDNVLFLADRLERNWSIEAEGLRCLDPEAQLSDLLVRTSQFQLVS